MISTASWLSLSVYLWYITHLNAIFIRCQLPLFHIWVTKVPEKYYNYQAPHPLAIHKPNVNHNDNHFPKEEEKDKAASGSWHEDIPMEGDAGTRGEEARGERPSSSSSVPCRAEVIFDVFVEILLLLHHKSQSFVRGDYALSSSLPALPQNWLHLKCI